MPLISEKILGGKGKTKEKVYWLTEHFLVEYEEDKRYSMQNEIRRLTDEVYYSTNLSSISNGSPRTLEIELDERYIDENNFISTRVISKAGDYYRNNDISMFEYLEYIPDETIKLNPAYVSPAAVNSAPAGIAISPSKFNPTCCG